MNKTELDQHVADFRQLQTDLAKRDAEAKVRPEDAVSIDEVLKVRTLKLLAMVLSQLADIQQQLTTIQGQLAVIRAKLP